MTTDNRYSIGDKSTLASFDGLQMKKKLGLVKKNKYWVKSGSYWVESSRK